MWINLKCWIIKFWIKEWYINEFFGKVFFGKDINIFIKKKLDNIFGRIVFFELKELVLYINYNIKIKVKIIRWLDFRKNKILE